MRDHPITPRDIKKPRRYGLRTFDEQEVVPVKLSPRSTRVDNRVKIQEKKEEASRSLPPRDEEFQRLSAR